LGELLNNPEKRRLIGKNARDKFINNFSQEAIFQKYLSVLGD
jgi:glycosyltransferase involved in cell wall biosynthesis